MVNYLKQVKTCHFRQQTLVGVVDMDRRHEVNDPCSSVHYLEISVRPCFRVSILVNNLSGVRDGYVQRYKREPGQIRNGLKHAPLI